jgi:hypothetical protein
MRALLRNLALASALLALSGCQTYSVGRYTVSSDNVQMLRALQQKYPQGALKVGAFKHKDKYGRQGIPLKEVMCRGAGPIKPPDNQGYEQFLQKALADELKMAGVYAESSPIGITASLETLDFSSTDGTWTLSAQVAAGQQPFPVEMVSKYDTSFMGDNACAQTAQAFVPAAQDFVRKLISSPQFERAFAESAKPSAPAAATVPGT